MIKKTINRKIYTSTKIYLQKKHNINYITNEKKKCKELEEKIKCIITKQGVLYGNQYKCKLKSEKYTSSIKLACRRCPKQYELFDDEMNNERLNR